MASESCGICGGEGRIQNAFGSQTTCPSCRGSGIRLPEEGFRDVTKTKPSHFRGANKAAEAVKASWPATFAGENLAKEVQASGLSNETKAKLVRDIMDHESTHSEITKTFVTKLRKLYRPVG